MDKIKLIADLNVVIEKNNLKKSKVEETLRFPKNGLSNFLAGKKELPDKWVLPIQSYIDCFNPENKPAPINKESESKDTWENVYNELRPRYDSLWAEHQVIVDFCNDNNCTPQDLMDAYKSRKTFKPMPPIQKVNKHEIRDLTPENNPMNQWRSDYRKKKLGL